MGYKVNNRCDTGGLPMYLVKPLIDYCNVPTFIETGTAGGLSIKEAAKYFKHCHTIELIEGRAEIDTNLENVMWHTGNSVDILLPIVNNLIAEKNAMQIAGKPPVYNYAFFWLDAHYSDPTPNTSKYKECYLLEEIEIISGYHNDAIIFIDDARLFFGHPPAPNNPKDWPTIREIFALFEKLYPYNTTTIRDDYIISYPERLDEPFDEEWVSKYSIRYPTESEKLRTETRNVFNALKKYIDAT